MRPRKNILMLCANERDASVFRFVIHNHNAHRRHCGGMFNVVSAATVEEARTQLQAFERGFFACILNFGLPAADGDMERAYPVIAVERGTRPEDWLLRMDAASEMKRGPKQEDAAKTAALGRIHAMEEAMA